MKFLRALLRNFLRIKDKEYKEQMRAKTVMNIFAGLHNLI